MSLQLNSELFPDKETYFAENFINENLIFILRVVNLIDPLKTGQNYKIISWAGQSVWLTWQSVCVWTIVLSPNANKQRQISFNPQSYPRQRDDLFRQKKCVFEF
jgi:hypothetical protein